MIQVLGRAFDVIETLSCCPNRPMALGEIASAVSLHPATCARILHSLVERGYAEQVGRRKGYLLGPMAHAVAASGPYRRDLTFAAEPELQRLAACTGDTCLLAVLIGRRRYTIARAHGGEDVQVSADLVLMESPFRTATGRLLLSALSPIHLDRVLEDVTFPLDDWPEVRSADVAREFLHAIRGRDLLICEDRSFAALASPVLQRGDTVASVGLYLPSERFSGTHRQLVTRGVRDCAARISSTLR